MKSYAMLMTWIGDYPTVSSEEENEDESTKDDDCIDVKDQKVVQRECVDLVDTDNDDDDISDGEDELFVRAPQRSDKRTLVDVECLDVDRDMILPATTKRQTIMNSTRSGTRIFITRYDRLTLQNE
jgi:hypothetical protein